MIYKFSLDEVDYEADVTVTEGRPGVGPSMENAGGEPSEPDEIELNHLWLVGPLSKIKLDPRFSTQYDIVEKHLLDCGTDILREAYKNRIADEAEEGDARNDRRKEDF